MDALTAENSPARERVIAFLAFLTSEDCHSACRELAQQEELAAAFTRLWFDEIYVPGDSTLDGLKPAPDPEELARFKACFSTRELNSLERFHGFFELRLSFLTNKLKGRAYFPDNDSWRSILQHAAYVLDELVLDPDHLRVMLAALVRHAKQGTLIDAMRGQLTFPSAP